jgi:hypothetical protein
MGRAIDKDSRPVMHPKMGVTDTGQTTIGLVFIGMNCRARFCVFLNKGSDGRRFGILNDSNLHLSLIPTGDADHRGFVFGTAPALAARHFAAKVRLIRFYVTTERVASLASSDRICLHMRHAVL